MAAEYQAGDDREVVLSIRQQITGRRFVRIEGLGEYAVGGPEDLSPIRYERAAALWQRLLELARRQRERTVFDTDAEPDEAGEYPMLRRGQLTFDEETEWEQTVEAVAEIVLLGLARDGIYEPEELMPRAVFAGLDARTKWRIANLFFGLVTGRATEVMRTLRPVEAAAPSTGDSSPPNARASTTRRRRSG